MGYIYRIYNDINDKCYIGLTTNTVETRWKKHLSNSSLVKYHLYDAMRLYGVEHFFIETIEQVEDEILPLREQYWIQHYDSFCNGYNETRGGEGNRLYCKEIFYNLWDKGYSIGEIAKEVKCMRSTVYEALLDYENYSVEESLRRRAVKKQKRVCQFDLQGNLLNVFDSVKEAEKALNIERNGTIGQCCAMKYGHKTVKNYFWLWEQDKDKITQLVESLNNGHRKQKVAQLDNEGRVIAIFNSAKEAAQSFGKIKDSHIGDCCKGRRKSCFGYKWRYEI